MINQTTKDKIEILHRQYLNLAKGNESILKEIALAEIPELVYNSNAIENSTKTRIVVADTKIHIVGSFSNIKLARDAVCRLIMGSPANKIYNHLRAFAKRRD